MASHVGEADQTSISGDTAENTNPIDQSDVASQHSQSTIGGTSSLRDNPRIRVYVLLGNGERLLVPVHQRATVQDLQFATLRRAARFGVTATLADTVLRTIGSQAAVIDGSDLVEDFIDLTQDNTFSLGVLNPIKSESTLVGAPSSISVPIVPALIVQKTTPASLQNQSIYVRWITTHEAIDMSRLDKIPVDQTPFDTSATLSDLEIAAVQRLCQGRWALSVVQATRVNLWLKECPLATGGSSATLADLGLSGSVHHPLDVFVQILGDQSCDSFGQVSEAVTPRTAWGFNTTNRGLSTFVTCLSVLLEEIERDKASLNTVLDALLEITHFPPALLALQHVFDKKLDSGSRVNPESLLLLADLFNCICNKMVPDWICNTSESRLEGSRQIFSWFHSLCIGAKQSSVTQCVYRFQTFPCPSGNGDDTTAGALFAHTEVVNLPLLTNENAPAPAASGSKYVVSVEGPGRQLAYRLASAVHRESHVQGRWEYYFSNAEDWNEFLARPALHRPGPGDFDNLLADANVYPAFKMIDPMQLGGCLSADLPVITLSSKGYVSLYDQEDIGCGEREFYLHNAIEGKVKMNQVDPGQFISQKLEAIILERKKQGSWEVDAWSEWLETAYHGEPDESIVICIDTSSSMNNKMERNWNPKRDGLGETESRLHEVKEFFHQFSTRLSSYALSTHVGLINFSGVGKVNVIQPLTMLQLDFRDKLSAVNASGCTAIFNALSLAHAMLTTQKASFPKTKCRIILLTDGEDNQSDIAASSIASKLMAINIVLDAIVIGSDATRDLFKICRSTGGYAFHPLTQHVFFQIFLLETFVDIRTRPDIEKVYYSDWAFFGPKLADMRDSFTFPPCRPHPNQQDYFISLGSAHKFLRRKAASQAYSKTMYTTSTLQSSRTATTGGPRILLSEVKAMIDNLHPNMDIYVSQSNIGFWKVIMEGPEGSPYEPGTFMLYIDIGDDFPRVPPAVRFITQILHPNISKHGRICHPIFDREWSPLIHVYEVLQHIFGMLMSLESRDAIDPISALRFYTDPEEGRQQVAAYIQRFATSSRQQLAAQVMNGHDSSSIGGDSTVTLTPGPSSASRHSSVSLSGQTIAATGVPDAPRQEPTGSSSSLASHLALSRGFNRRPAPTLPSSTQALGAPPPLIAQSSQSNERNVPASSTRELPLTASNLATMPESDSNARASPSAHSRRASFFAKLRRAGS